MKHFIKFLLLFCAFGVNGQIPGNDPTWQIKKEDHFTGTTLNTTQNWHNQYSWGPTNNGLEYNNPNNLILQNDGWLQIKCEELSTPIQAPNGNFYDFQGGAIHSRFAYKYGYWEISAKLPVGSGYGYWPAFWLLGIKDDFTGPYKDCLPDADGNRNNDYEEIDIVENNGLQSAPGNIMGINYHWRDKNDCIRKDWNWSTQGGNNGQTVPGNISAEHKYGLLWEPGKMTFFFDDKPIRIIEDNVYTPENELYTIINFAVDTDNPPTQSTFQTAYFKINWFKLHQLEANCNANASPVNICSFNAATYDYKVQKSINISGSNCTSNINTSQNISLWATDYIQLNEGTTITNNGSGSFLMYITKCPN